MGAVGKSSTQMEVIAPADRSTLINLDRTIVKSNSNLQAPKYLSDVEVQRLSKDEKHKYVAEVADNAWKESLASLGIKEDEAHLLSTAQRDSLRNAMRARLRRANADLSFDATTTKNGVRIAGNADGIASGYLSGPPVRKGWTEVEMTPAQIKRHLQTHKNASVYREDRYGGVVKGSNEFRKQLADTKFGSSYRNQGIGSQSSVVQTTVKLYKDKKGNLKLSSFSMTWD